MSKAGADLALLQKLMANTGRDMFAGMFDEPTPEVREVPERSRGFRVRVDLMYAKPPIWRRLDLPGDLMLDELHVVLQVAMGWEDSHLHKFGVGVHRRTRAYFVTGFDLSEGDEGVAEDEVRLDQVVSVKGDRLFYDYDFGDGWEHVLVVEDVLDDPPPAPVCLRARCHARRRTAAAWAATRSSPSGFVADTTRERRPWGSAPRRCGTGCPRTGIPTVSRWTRPTTLWLC